MKKLLHSFALLLFAFALLGGVPEARASHLLGGDMTYVSLGNNQYRVKFRLYRDCSSSRLAPPTSCWSAATAAAMPLLRYRRSW